MRRTLARFLVLASIMMGGAVFATQPASAAGSCAGAGYLCMYDYNSSTYGNVADSNPDFRVFGWNDRADWFQNNGRYCNVRLYEHINYNTGYWSDGDGYTMALGTTYVWYNTVSSNKWCV